jgi:hypothetical protein
MSRGKPVYSDGRVHVMRAKCDTCIFRPGNKMNLNTGRVKQMVEDSIAEGGGITCHKTIYGGNNQEATCHGFFDSYADRVPALRLAEAYDMVEYIDLTEPANFEEDL